MITLLGTTRTEIFQWGVPDFFSKLTFYLSERFKTRGKSLQLPDAYGRFDCYFAKREEQN